MAADILFPFFHWCSENRRPKLWGGLVIWNFSVQSIFMKWQPFFNFFLMADADIPFLSKLRKLTEMQIFRWFSFTNFLLVQFSMSPILGSVSMFKTFKYEHLCIVTFLHFTWKTGQEANFLLISFPNFLLVQFSPSPILGSVSTFKTFMCGNLSAFLSSKWQEKSAKIGLHIYA